MWSDFRFILLPSNDKLTLEVDSRNVSIKFVNLKRKHERVSDLTVMQTFNLTTLSNNEVNKSVSKTQEIKGISFQYIRKALIEIDENYPFLMPNWLLIIIKMIGMM